MNALPTKTKIPLFATLDQLVIQHGSLRTLAMTLLAILRPKPKPSPLLPGTFNAHLLRDIGLPAEPSAPKYWQLR